MSIFSKQTSKEYNEHLENILENKKVNSDAKNLLLSMLYKIENSYKDYYTVKFGMPTKEEFIEKILTIIDEECSEIIVVTPETNESKSLDELNENCIIDVLSGKIIVYANEKDLLYSIFMMNIKYNQYKINKEYDLGGANKNELIQFESIQKFFSVGTSINKSEVIRDFSGWSWSANPKEIKDIKLNLVYQNISLLVGTNILDKILISDNGENQYSNLIANVKDLRKYNRIDEDKTTKKNINSYNDIIKEVFNQTFNNDDVKVLIYYIKLFILILEVQNNDEKIKQISNRLKEEEKVYRLMDNKEEFLNSLEKNIKKLKDSINKNKEIIKDKSLLEKEYKKRNSKLANNNKIFSTSHLVKLLEKENKQYEMEIKVETKLFEPKLYNQRQIKYKKEIEFYRELVQNINSVDDILIKIQIEFLKSFSILIKKAATKNDLISLIYKLRYYCLIPIKDNKKIFEIPELEEEIREVMNQLIDKCISKKVIENVSNSISLCYMILKYIFTTQTIDLEKIELKITKYDEKVININENKEKVKNYYIIIDLFDGKEQVERHTEIVDNLKLLNIRLKKKTPLFL